MKVFLNEPIDHDAYLLLKKHFEIIDQWNRIDECDIILSRNHHIDQLFLDQCHHLQLIAVHGTGYDDVDIDYAKKRGIHLINSQHENALSVAELIVALMLELSRKIIPLSQDKKNNLIYETAPIQYLGHELSHKTVGLIGTGDIALKAAHILREGFHMHIMAYSRSLTKEKAKEMNIEYCQSINEVFQKADYVSICVALTPDTYHIIQKEQLSLLKPTAYLINTSRGAIINEEDLYVALKEHWFTGAGLDVLENEPIPSNHPLLSLDNVIYTSHMGASTEEALKRVGMKIVEKIIQFQNDPNSIDYVF